MAVAMTMADTMCVDTRMDNTRVDTRVDATRMADLSSPFGRSFAQPSPNTSTAVSSARIRGANSKQRGTRSDRLLRAVRFITPSKNSFSEEGRGFTHLRWVPAHG